MEDINRKKSLFEILIVVVALIWSAFTINTGLFIDENGLLAIYKGIYQGQRMFVDAWGPYQMAGIITYPFFALYDFVLGSALESIGIGLVLYFRILYLILRFLICLYLYFTVKKTEFENGALAGSIFTFLFILGYKSISYKSICDFGILLFICYLIRYLQTKYANYFALMGVATCMMILSYPTMIIFPFVVGVIMLVMSYNGYELLKPFFVYLITCVVIGMAFLTYLGFTSGLGNVFAQLKYLEDSDFESPLYIRMGKMLLSYAAFAVIAYLPVIVLKFIEKIRYLSKMTYGVILSLYWIFFFMAVCLLRAQSVSDSRFAYACLLIFYWLPLFIGDDEKGEYTLIGQYKVSQVVGKHKLFLIWVVSLVAQIAWAISTNQDISVPAHMSYYSIVAFILLITYEDYGFALLKNTLLLVALFFSCFWISEGNGGYSDILEERWIVERGAFKGIALVPEDYQSNEDVMTLIDGVVTEDDYLLVAFGSNSTGYLNSVAHQAAPSAYTRTHLNTRLLDFWNENPEDEADYVLIDTSSTKYETFIESECGRYIFNNYKTEVGKQGTFELLAK